MDGRPTPIPAVALDIRVPTERLGLATFSGCVDMSRCDESTTWTGATDTADVVVTGEDDAATGRSSRHTRGFYSL